MLVSQGAHAFAVSNGVPTCDAGTLVAPHCISEWEHWKKVLADSSPSVPQQGVGAEAPVQDTVGAVSWDSIGKLASGVSRFGIASAYSRANSAHSGGLLLKCPGRIGEVSGQRDCLRQCIKFKRLQYLVPGVGHSLVPELV